MVSMFVMILAPDVQFVGMAALWLQLILPWVLVAYVGFLPQRFTFAATRVATMPPWSLLLLVLFGAVYNGAVGVAFTYVEVVTQGRLLVLASVLALPLLGAMLVVDSRGPRSWNWVAVAFLALASFSYSYWGLRWINIVFDDSPQAAMSSVVARKFKGVWVRVQPWGPVRDAKAVQVPHVIYRVFQPKRRVGHPLVHRPDLSLDGPQGYARWGGSLVAARSRQRIQGQLERTFLLRIGGRDLRSHRL
jgi:hypothetical protein